MHTEQQLPVTWDITINRGSVWEYTGRIETGDTLLDTTGWSMEFTIKESLDEASPLIAKFTTANARCLTGIHSDGEHDVNWWIKLTALDTALLPVGIFYYNIWLTPPDGSSNRQAVFAGTCCIEQEVRA